MTITLNEDYDVTLSTALLGYVGETNARPVTIEGMEIDGADRYVLTIDYGDSVQYEVDITGGQWTPTADILRAAQTVSCQIAAKKLSGQEYILVKKSRIFRLRIGAAIGDTAVPSPDVAVDALDRIDAIGRQAHADMQTAQTAAKTATTVADNAAKSATAAGVSADTATQAAERAETAQTAAETSAAQAETSKQGAETARTEAVTSQNNAKISAAQASTAAQQTTADKNITAGYAKTAKTAADSTTADRQAVQTLAEQVTADKTTVAGNAAKVATDRKATEAAAQTAQAVADSLPDDYVTAVEKIAENTADIADVRLTDKELQRRVNALYDMGQGITHKFETDSETAYAKAVPTGAKLMSVKNVGGRSLVWNQLVDSNIDISETTRYSFSGQHLTTNITDNLSLSDDLCALPTIPAGHKVLLKIKFIAGNVGNKEVNVGGYHITTNNSWQCKIDLPKNADLAGKSLFAMDTTTDTSESIRFFLYDATIPLLTNIDCYINYYDLTLMFGSGNEPSTVEEFEAMFPNDYYPYNAGEIVSAGVTEVVEQGKNLLDFKSAKLSNSYRYISDVIPDGKKAIMSFVDKDTSVDISGLDLGIGFANITDNPDSPPTEYNWVLASNGLSENKSNLSTKNDKSVLCGDVFIYPKTDEALTKLLSRYDIQVELGDTATAYTPYHRNEYAIPEAIKSLPGYGWSAGTARNYVDYENKRYVQCVNSADLGTKNWLMYKDGDYTPFFYLNSISDIQGGTSNLLCPKYQYTKIDVTGNESGLYVLENTTVRVRDTAYTDATTFKQAMQGVMLYYELATPIVTDISTLIDDDFLRNIEVEAGGSITFKGSNDSYRIPVPSEEEYIVKLSEIGGTT